MATEARSNGENVDLRHFRHDLHSKAKRTNSLGTTKRHAQFPDISLQLFFFVPPCLRGQSTTCYFDGTAPTMSLTGIPPFFVRNTSFISSLS